jgi:hypothetical protein
MTKPVLSILQVIALRHVGRGVFIIFKALEIFSRINFLAQKEKLFPYENSFSF